MRATAQQPQRAPDGAPFHYERHRPEQTTLYRLVQQHAASFIAHTEASTGAGLPRFIKAEPGHKQSSGLFVPGEGPGHWPGAACKAEFDAFLECGILAHGFLRLRCGECGHDKLLAFSCKHRGFCEAGAPTDDELDALLHTIIARLMKMLTRRGVLVEDMGQTYLAEPDSDGEEARTLRPLQAAAITYRIAFGPRAGQEVLTLRGAMPREDRARQPLCAGIDGFSLHAAVRVEAHDRKRLEQLCRYITRPALSDERVQLNAAGQAELKLKTPWRDGTTHLVMSPLEFMQRLAALVPRPRLHLIRFHGVLAPNAKLRPLVVPQGPQVQEAASEAAAAAECEVESLQARPNRISWARLLKRVLATT